MFNDIADICRQWPPQTDLKKSVGEEILRFAGATWQFRRLGGAAWTSTEYVGLFLRVPEPLVAAAIDEAALLHQSTALQLLTALALAAENDGFVATCIAAPAALFDDGPCICVGLVRLSFFLPPDRPKTPTVETIAE